MPLKGRTKIELFKNGRPVLTHEEGNLVTNMVSDALLCRLGPSYFAGTGNLDRTVIYKGLLLFRDSITETAAAYGIPGNNSITGRGYESNTLSADLDTGVFNTNLSTQSNSRISYVWDFDEEHGNGRISCVSLVPQNIAHYLNKTAPTSYAVPPHTDGYFSRPVFECLSADTLPVYADVTNQCVYCIALSSTGNMSISKYFPNQLRPLVGATGMVRFSPGELQNRSVGILRDCYFTTVASVDLSQIITANGTNSFMMCDRDGYLYVCTTNSATVATNGTLHIAKVNIKTGAVTDYSLVNYSNESIQLRTTGLSGDRYYRPCNYEFNIFNGYFWFRTTTNHILAINITTNSTYHIVTGMDGVTPLTVSNINYHTSSSLKGGFMYETETASYRNDMKQTYVTRFAPLGLKSIGVFSGDYSYINKMDVYIVNTDSFSVESVFPEAYIYGNTAGGSSHHPGWQLTASSGLNLQLTSIPFNEYSGAHHFGGYFWQPMFWGLQTINNLDAPVTKTADLTMRVTYVLEEEEPVSMLTADSVLDNSNDE